MKSLSELLRRGKTPRVIGLDDAPFVHAAGERANVAGVVCAGVRFEGMLWGDIAVDGADATEQVLALVKGSKFYDQLHLVLLDGLAFGGFNLVDLPALSEALERPCAAIMRKMPDMERVEQALHTFEDAPRRLELVRRAGPILQRGVFTFQVAGAEPDELASALERVTDTGHVPEALRLAHLIGAAVKTGESSRRA